MGAGRRETGACYCGAVAFEAAGEPFWICFDHDDDCRRALGAALVVWVGYEPSQVRFLTEQPTWFSKTPGVRRAFCGRCGSSIAYRDEGTPDELYLALGVFDAPERLAPQAHAYWSMRLPTIRIDDDLPKIDRYSRTRDPALGEPADRKRED